MDRLVGGLWLVSAQRGGGAPPPNTHTRPHTLPEKAASFPVRTQGSSRASGAPAETALVCESKLPQFPGRVERHSSALHEKLKSCPDLMRGSG